MSFLPTQPDSKLPEQHLISQQFIKGTVAAIISGQLVEPIDIIHHVEAWVNQLADSGES